MNSGPGPVFLCPDGPLSNTPNFAANIESLPGMNRIDTIVRKRGKVRSPSGSQATSLEWIRSEFRIAEAARLAEAGG